MKDLADFQHSTKYKREFNPLHARFDKSKDFQPRLQTEQVTKPAKRPVLENFSRQSSYLILDYEHELDPWCFCCLHRCIYSHFSSCVIDTCFEQTQSIAIANTLDCSRVHL